MTVHLDTIKATTSIHIYTNDKTVLDAIRGMNCVVDIAHNRGPLTPEGMTPHALRQAADALEGKAATIGGGMLNHTTRCIVYPEGYTSLTLTPTEFRLVLALMDAYPNPLTREDAHTVLDFPGEWHPLDRNMDVIVGHLRPKLKKKNHIKTIHGLGYSL